MLNRIRSVYFAIAPGWRPLLFFAIACTVAICVVSARRAESSSDFRDFWRTAGHLRETGQISNELGVHNYLPFFPIFMLPWSFLPLPVAIVLFNLLSCASFAGTVLIVEVLLNERLGRRPRAATYAAIGLMLPYAWSCGVLGQLALLLTFLVVMAWLLALRGNEYPAGVALGLAALIKLFPGLLIIFFAVRGRWRVCIAALAVILILGVCAPWSVLGWKGAVESHKKFRDTALNDHSARNTIFAEKPPKTKYNNNALPMVLRRLLSPTDYDPHEEKQPSYANIVRLPAAAIWALYLIIAAAAVTVALAAGVLGRRSWPPLDLPSFESSSAQFGVWCALALLITPLLWTHYLPFVYWPLALLCDQFDRKRRATQRLPVVITLALATWTLALIALASPLARAAGAQLVAVFALFGVCAVLSLAHDEPPPSRPSPRKPAAPQP